MAVTFEPRIYPERRRWHFTILRRTSSSTVSVAVYESRQDVGEGYATYEDALAGGLNKSTELMSRHDITGVAPQ